MALPTHFDPTGQLLAICSDADCIVFERKTGAVHGKVPRALCGEWKEGTVEHDEEFTSGSRDREVDPVTGETWAKTGVCGHSCSESVEGSTSWYGSERDDSVRDEIVGSNAAGTAFVRRHSEEAHDGTDGRYEVFTLRPKVAHWSAFSGCCNQTVAIALVGDGARAVMVVHEPDWGGNPASTRIFLASADGQEDLTDPEFAEAFKDTETFDLELEDGEKVAWVSAGSMTYRRPLDSGAKGGMLNPKHAGSAVSAAAKAPAFRFVDGLLSRASDGEEIDLDEPCRFPSSIAGAKPAAYRVREGGVLDGKLLAKEEVQRRFCPPGLLSLFVSGAPMPPPPEE
jgi:hypothetical protein